MSFTLENAYILDFFSFSDWHKAKRAMIVCFNLQKIYKLHHNLPDTTKTKGNYSHVNVYEIMDAETETFKQESLYQEMPM